MSAEMYNTPQHPEPFICFFVLGDFVFRGYDDERALLWDRRTPSFAFCMCSASSIAFAM